MVSKGCILSAALMLTGCSTGANVIWQDRKLVCPASPPPIPDINRDVDKSASLGSLKQECKVCWKTIDAWEEGHSQCVE